MTLYRDKRDYERFIAKLYEYKMKCDVEVLVYCLMPNHFHFLLLEPEVGRDNDKSNISIFMHRLLISYAKYFSYKYDHSGVVFQSRFQSKMINSDAYYEKIKEYILNNPVRKDW